MRVSSLLIMSFVVNSLLIINENLSESNRIKNLLAHSRKCDFIVETVANFEEARIITQFQDYNGYLISDSLPKYSQWAKEVAPKPVILLTNEEEIGLKALKKGLTDYILYEEISTRLLETSLRLSFFLSQYKK